MSNPTLEVVRREPSMFIEGKAQGSESGARFDVFDPATGSVISSVPEADEADVDRAVAFARKTFDEGVWWPGTPDRERGKILMRAAAILEREQERLALLDTLDCGKPIGESRLDVEECAIVLEYYAGLADKLDGSTPPAGPDGITFTIPEPVGVVAAIVAWNYPLALAVQKIAPAIAAGCTIILKPAEQTPLSALELPAIFEEAGLPEGVLQVVTGAGPVGAALVAHPGVDKVTFTGSREVGVQVMQSAAQTIKRVTLELGGKSPNIVFADADLELAIEGSCEGIFGNQGEICTAGSRILVERSAYDDVVAGMVARLGDLRAGAGVDESTTMGPLVSMAQKERVDRYIEIGKNEARMAGEGTLPQDAELANGYFVRPTVFADVDNKAVIAQEEIFGPVASVMPFDGFDHAIQLANDTVYGLAGAIWTTNVTTAFRAARALRAGQLWINDTQAAPLGYPAGGYKQSGFGREGGREGLADFTELKAVYLRLDR